MICVDASVALLWLLPDELTALAEGLRRRCLQERISMIAPQIFRAEVTSAIRLWAHSERVEQSFARDALRRALEFPVLIEGGFEALQIRAFDLATTLKQPRAYDTQYLALAEFRGCQMWTADQRFVNAARRDFPNVKWIGDFPV